MTKVAKNIDRENQEVKTGVSDGELGELDLSDEEVDNMIKQADKDIARLNPEMYKEVRINFRWKNLHLQALKRIAARKGLPYQTYIKYALLKQFLEDEK